MDNLVVSRMELPTRLVHISSTRNPSSVVLNQIRRVSWVMQIAYK